MAEIPEVEELFLTREDQETLERLGPALAMIAKNIEKCEKAGLDMTQQKKDLENSKSLSEGMLRELQKP